MTAPALPPAGDLLTVTATGDATSCRLHAAGEVDTSSAARLAAVLDADWTPVRAQA